jgi:2-oxoglutarate dehydrogenase complex dehydrogenase (E1) component-like enzyme
VILTPKSLLRHHEVVSSWEELELGIFRPVIEDPRAAGDRIQRVLLCMGKLYYDLARERQERGCADVSLMRIEQFYPLPSAALQKALEPYPVEMPIVWCQEEPANMGAWRYLQSVWPTIAPARPPLDGVTRPESASPATGSHSSHRHEQQTLLARALAQS